MTAEPTASELLLRARAKAVLDEIQRLVLELRSELELKQDGNGNGNETE